MFCFVEIEFQKRTANYTWRSRSHLFGGKTIGQIYRRYSGVITALESSVIVASAEKLKLNCSSSKIHSPQKVREGQGKEGQGKKKRIKCILADAPELIRQTPGLTHRNLKARLYVRFCTLRLSSWCMQ